MRTPRPPRRMFQDRLELFVLEAVRTLNPETRRQETKEMIRPIWTGQGSILPVEARHRGAYSDAVGGAEGGAVTYRVMIPAGRPSEAPEQLVSDEAVQRNELRVRDLRTGETLASVARPVDLASAGQIYMLECGDRVKT